MTPEQPAPHVTGMVPVTSLPWCRPHSTCGGGGHGCHRTVITVMYGQHTWLYLSPVRTQ